MQPSPAASSPPIKTHVVLPQEYYNNMLQQLRRAKETSRREEQQHRSAAPVEPVADAAAAASKTEQPPPLVDDDDPTVVVPAPPHRDSDECPEVERLLQFLPAQRREAARQCLLCLAGAGGFRFCPASNEIYVHDRLMKGSNIVDLLAYLLRPSVVDSKAAAAGNRREPPGWLVVDDHHHHRHFRSEFQHLVSRSGMPCALLPSTRQRERLCILRKKIDS